MGITREYRVSATIKVTFDVHAHNFAEAEEIANEIVTGYADMSGLSLHNAVVLDGEVDEIESA